MRTRMTLVRLLLAVLLLAAGIALGAPRAAQAATVCNDTVVGETFRGSVVVPAGGYCYLGDGTVVRGGLTAESGALVFVVNAEIRGSIGLTDPNNFGLYAGSVVRGSVTVTGTVVKRDQLFINDAEVRGDVVVSGFNGTWLQVQRNTVRGSMLLRNNTVPVGEFPVHANAIGGNLDCSGNTPAPELDPARPNTVRGAMLGQCAGL